MRIILSGYNYDIHYGEHIKTPETLSAAYARISRSPRDVNILRKQACNDVKKARKSNENIIFNLGHSSVAEHTVFNFDLINISRLAAEYIQKHRLASFTEKSQRYIKFENGYLIPEEIKNTVLEKEYIQLCNQCFQIYNEILKREDINISSDRIKEDARYFLPLSTYTQMGMTVNGRTLEYMIGKLMSSNIIELKNIAKAMLKQVERLAPSLIKYTDSREMYKVDKSIVKIKRIKKPLLIEYTPNATQKVCAYYLFENSGISLKQALKKAKNEKILKDVYREIFRKMEMWDKPHRSFEYAHYTFLLSLSASAFAQLKRHRISSLIAQNYMFDAPVVIPHTLKVLNYDKKLKFLHKKISNFSKKLYKINNAIYNYIAINATRRQVIINMNAREIYHFTRLRSDIHAQWEIRDISKEIEYILKKREPILFYLLGGKDKFNQLKESIDEL